MRAERLTKEVKAVVQAVRGLDIVRRYNPGKFGSVIVLGLQVLGFDLGEPTKILKFPLDNEGEIYLNSRRKG